MASEGKRQSILEAAIRRFGHFGIAKTTMSEIARDLAFSKALLYYYFPDKHSLYAASLQYVIRRSFVEIERRILAIEDCKEAMSLLLDKRIDFVSRHYNLLEYSVGAGRQLPRDMEPVFDDARRGQEQLIGAILEKGVRLGQLKDIDNIPEVSRMLLFAIEGMRFSILKRADEHLFPSAEEFDTILNLQKKMVAILLDGLARPGCEQ